MEKKLETILMGYTGFRELGLYWDDGKENGKYYRIIGYMLELY